MEKKLLLLCVIFFALFGCEKDEEAPVLLPTISSFSPETGEAGMQITIVGSNFNPAKELNEIMLIDNDKNSIIATVNSATTTEVKMTLPESTPPGLYTIRIKSNGHTVESSSKLSVTAMAPSHTLTSFYPEKVYPGLQFLIYGTKFSEIAENNEVSLVKGSESPIQIIVNEASSTTISATIPEDLPLGEYNIIVKVDGKAVSSTEVLSVVDIGNAPDITQISPMAVFAGESIVISGTDFGATIEDNRIDLVQGSTTIKTTITSASPTSLEVTIPATTASGEYTVRIYAGFYSSDFAPKLNVVQAHTITDFTPKDAEEGGRITISGTNFSTVPAENIVKLNQDGFTVSVEVIEATSTNLVVQIPSSVFLGSHHLEVTINDKTVRAAEKYTVGAFSTPNIESVSSTTIGAGDNFVITGTNFSYEPEVLYVILILDGTTSRNYATIISSTSTEINVSVPAYLEGGEYTLEVHKGSKKGTYLSKITIAE